MGITLGTICNHSRITYFFMEGGTILQGPEPPYDRNMWLPYLVLSISSLPESFLKIIHPISWSATTQLSNNFSIEQIVWHSVFFHPL